MGLRYQGIHPAADTADPKGSVGIGRLLLDVQRSTETIDSFPVSRSSVTNGIVAKKLTYITTPVDGSVNALTTLLPPPNEQKTGYADLAYYQTQDALRIGSLNCAINNPDQTSNLVGTTYNTDGAIAGTVLKPALATTGTDKLIPLAQLPSMGSGYLMGPLGYTATYFSGGSTAGGSFKVAEWNILQPSIGYFQPMVFMVVQAKSDFLGRALIEVRVSESQATTYNTSHPLVATGIGQSFYHTAPANIQSVAVMPCAASNGQSFSGTTTFGATYGSGTPKSFYLTAWMVEAGTAGTGSSSVYSLVSGSAFLMKMSS